MDEQVQRILTFQLSRSQNWYFLCRLFAGILHLNTNKFYFIGFYLTRIVGGVKNCSYIWRSGEKALSIAVFCHTLLGGLRMGIVNSIISKLNQFSSWLLSRQWERQEILTIALVAFSLLLLVLVARRKARTRIRYMPHSYVPRSTIGVRLANPAARH